MTHLTMWPVPSADGKTTFWKARCTPSVAHGYVEIESLDPVDAITRVLQLMQKAPKRTVGKHPALGMPYGKENQGTLPIDAIPGKETEDGNVTATVTDPSALETWLPKL